MRRKRMFGWFIGICLIIMATGCNQKQSAEKEDKTSVQPSGDAEAAEHEQASEVVTGQGFQPPKGSTRDKNGNIVDPQGNTFDEKGGWQIPEGGRVDAKGRIYDKNGKLMGGGAVIGSKG